MTERFLASREWTLPRHGAEEPDEPQHRQAPRSGGSSPPPCSFGFQVYDARSRPPVGPQLARQNLGVLPALFLQCEVQAVPRHRAWAALQPGRRLPGGAESPSAPASAGRPGTHTGESARCVIVRPTTVVPSLAWHANGL